MLWDTKKYPTPETADISQYPYALTKRLGEEVVLHWADVYKYLPFLRFNVYGTRSRHQEPMELFLVSFLRRN